MEEIILLFYKFSLLFVQWTKVKVEMPPCSEEVAIADGTVFVLFESASAKYFEGTDGMGKSPAPIDKLLEVSVASIW